VRLVFLALLVVDHLEGLRALGAAADQVADLVLDLREKIRKKFTKKVMKVTEESGKSH